MERNIVSPKPKIIRIPPPSRALEREFSSQIVRMIEGIKQRFVNQVFEGLNKGTVEKFQDKQIGNYATIFLDLTKKVSRKLLDQYSNERIESLTDEIMGKVDRRNADILYGEIEKVIGIDSKKLLQEEGLKATINALRTETEVWIEKLRDETLQSITANSLRVMSQGGTLAEVMSSFDGEIDKKKNSARTIARTQLSSYNSLLIKNRALNLGITQGIWDTSEDERVRPSHADRNGKIFDLKKGLYSSLDGKTLLPGVDINCRCVTSLILPTD